MGYAAVALLAATGAINTCCWSGAPEPWWDTLRPAAGMKVLLLLAMVAIALFNRAKVEIDAAGWFSANRGWDLRSAAAVSVLGTWPPAVRPSTAGQAEPILSWPITL
jgi:putative copper export protein